jgi:hypothetical protein
MCSVYGSVLGGPIHTQVGYDAHKPSLLKRIVEPVFDERHGDTKQWHY